MKTSVFQPFNRSKLRQILGREYYILKRKLQWFLGTQKWARTKQDERLPYIVFEHRSLIMRPLKDVDMYLQENKKTNLALAIQHLNGIVIQPRETFSIWRLVGRPTQRKGYLEGLVLKQGQIAKDTAGGLCQLGNLLFWIFAHSPLTVTERYRHGFDVFPDVNRTVPFGAGATLSYNHIDLQVKNETEQSFQLCLWLDDQYLNGVLRAQYPLLDTYTVEERNHMIQMQHWGGYTRHNQIYQIKTNEQREQSERLLVENHAIMMYNPYLEQAKTK